MGPAEIQPSTSTTSKKRRIRRKKLQTFRSAKSIPANQENNTKLPDLPANYNCDWITDKEIKGKLEVSLAKVPNSANQLDKTNNQDFKLEMSPNDEKKSREDVKAAREAKKLAKLKAKNKEVEHIKITKESTSNAQASSEEKKNSSTDNVTVATKNTINLDPPVVPISKETPKSKDEVDRASIKADVVKLEGAKSKDQINVERAAKKAAKQSKKKKEGGGDVPAAAEMTVQDVVETLKDIVSVAKEMQDVTAKVQAISLDPQKKQADESAKSKAEIKAERRAKQEAQRAAKQATTQKVAPSPKEEPKAKTLVSEPIKEVKVPKAKSVENTKPKSQSENRVNWFQHLDMPHDKEYLLNIPINSNIHPAIIKLGVQLATRVVSGSNARCIALLDALKQMVRDYSLPAKTEFARGLEATLAAGLRYLWRLRQPSASQENAVKFFRHHLAQLPNNVDEFDAKKTLQEEIDRYIHEQIDMAGEAISLAVRAKISSGDLILTYGCSSLIERILREAWAAGVQFRVVVVGSRVNGGGREMLRRLTAAGVPTHYADVAALSFVMASVSKVLVGASALLVNGSVLAAAGTAQAALVARAHNTPVLVACETHKFSERVQTDAFVFNEIGDPDELIDKSDSNSPLKDWRSNPNLTPLNLTYDVTPPSLVTAVVTELAILPCTSAPVVLRFKLSEYGV